MAWTATTGAAPTSGYTAQGQTSVRWGSKNIVKGTGSALTGIPTETTALGTHIGIVTRFNHKQTVDNIKLPNGDGLTVTRVQIVDGTTWDVTMRDDTGLGARPTVGTTVVIADGGGFVSTAYNYYTALVVESSWDTAPKQPGELTFTVERLTLIEAIAYPSPG